jgi:hypothetical protein
MYCPDCGLEDKQSNQFCRACGTDLRPVRTAIAEPDAITLSAATARDEIGRAFAAKIRETQNPKDLEVVAEDVLPELEKFLESPEEKRMRRMRAGMLLSTIGIGTALGVALISAFVTLQDTEIIFIFALAGIVTFFIGVGFLLNGSFLTVPRKVLSDKSPDADSQRALDSGRAQTTDLVLPQGSNLFSSVTENTTRHLKEKEPVSRD